MLLLQQPVDGPGAADGEEDFRHGPRDRVRGRHHPADEQNAKLALETADRGYVMESGEITLQGEARSLLDDPKVRQAYLGEG